MLKVELAPGGARKVKKQNKNVFFFRFFLPKKWCFLNKKQAFLKILLWLLSPKFSGRFSEKTVFVFSFFHFFRKPFDYRSFLTRILKIFAVWAHLSTQFHKITKNEKANLRHSADAKTCFSDTFFTFFKKSVPK